MYTQSRCHLIHQIYIVWHGIDAEVEEKDENRYFPSCVAFVYIRSRHSRFTVCKYICLVIAGGPEPGGSPTVLWAAVISMIVWCEHMKNTSTILPAITPPHPPLLLLVPSGGERKIDDRQDARNLPLPSLSVRLKESLFFFPFFFLKPLKLEFWFHTRDDAEWINSPRQAPCFNNWKCIQSARPLQHISGGFSTCIGKLRSQVHFMWPGGFIHSTPQTKTCKINCSYTETASELPSQFSPNKKKLVDENKIQPLIRAL